MNWGKGIALSMILFMAFIVTLTVIKLGKVNDLEHENYYQREINYEQEIQAQRNAQSLEEIIISEKEDLVVFNIPESLDTKEVKIVFLRLNDKKLDKEYVFRDTKTIIIPKSELTKGHYKMEVIYQVNQLDCLVKTEIII